MILNDGAGNTSETVTNIAPIQSVFDSTANDSDKTWTVPGNETWEMNFAHVKLVSTATVGNRIITATISDEDGNELIDLVSGKVQAASATVHYAFLQGIFRETTVVNGELQVPLPRSLFLKPGYTIQFHDSAAIDAAADDMTVSFQYKKYVGWV
jgi:hypothetical protein